MKYDGLREGEEFRRGRERHEGAVLQRPREIRLRTIGEFIIGADKLRLVGDIFLIEGDTGLGSSDGDKSSRLDIGRTPG